MPKRRRNPDDAAFEACYLLKEQGWFVTRWRGSPSPPNLFAIREGEFLVLMVRHTHQPLKGAGEVVVRYRKELDRMRNVGIPVSIRMECWIMEYPDGWKCYEVLPAGIRRIWRKGISPVKEENPEHDEDEDARYHDCSIHGRGIKENDASTPVKIVRSDFSPKIPELPGSPATIAVGTVQDEHCRKNLDFEDQCIRIAAGITQEDQSRMEPGKTLLPAPTAGGIPQNECSLKGSETPASIRYDRCRERAG